MTPLLRRRSRCRINASSSSSSIGGGDETAPLCGISQRQQLKNPRDNPQRRRSIRATRAVSAAAASNGSDSKRSGHLK